LIISSVICLARFLFGKSSLGNMIKGCVKSIYRIDRIVIYLTSFCLDKSVSYIFIPWYISSGIFDFFDTFFSFKGFLFCLLFCLCITCVCLILDNYFLSRSLSRYAERQNTKRWKRDCCENMSNISRIWLIFAMAKNREKTESLNYTVAP
jgi:hypothetical protein